MAYIKGEDRNQMCLPPCIDDLVSEDNPVRVIDAFVDTLDLSEMGFAKDKPAETGRPAYDPRDLLKLYIYGYFNKIRSSRKLMTECARNIELFFLLNRLTPDFRTIADFRKENSEPIRKVFLEFTKLCIAMELYQQELLAIDGSKFRAVNGNKRMYNQEILKKKLQRIEEKLTAYLKEMDLADLEKNEDDQEKKNPFSSRSEKIKTLKDRKALYQSYQKELIETGQTQKLTTDPEAKMMHSHKDGFHCCYNVQTAVDRKNHLIISYLLTNHVNDQGILYDFCNSIKKELGHPTLKIIADKGYDCKEEILACILEGVLPYVGFCNDKEQRLFVLEYQPAPITDRLRNSTKPQDIQTCLHAGILPSCYEGSGLSVEIKPLGQIGAFIRGADHSFVTCPMGQVLPKTRQRGPGTVYAKRSICPSCQNRCTTSKSHKTVYFGPESCCVAAMMYGDQPAINIPPPDFIPTNSFFKKNPIQKTVLLSVADDIPKQKERLCVSEHPFGTVKWYHGAHYFLCRGISKTTAEIGLSFLAYNLRRAINLVGTKQLIEVMRGV